MMCVKRKRGTNVNDKPAGFVDQGWYWVCLVCGRCDAGFVSEEYARDALAEHEREGCPE